jgi:hypothetical protein
MVDGDKQCTVQALADKYPDRCVGPTLMKPIIDEAFADGQTGDRRRPRQRREDPRDPRLVPLPLRLQGGRDLRSSAKAADCDSAWAYYTGVLERHRRRGLLRRRPRRQQEHPRAHLRRHPRRPLLARHLPGPRWASTRCSPTSTPTPSTSSNSAGSSSTRRCTAASPSSSAPTPSATSRACAAPATAYAAGRLGLPADRSAPPSSARPTSPRRDQGRIARRPVGQRRADRPGRRRRHRRPRRDLPVPVTPRA